MRPALSVIFFTVSSGAGLGLLIYLALMGIADNVPTRAMIPMLLVGLGLTTAGLISSTLHLANPKNAWRAFSKFRTSWLSREGVLAVALYPVAILYGLLLVAKAPAVATTMVALLLALIALGVLYSTGMIYACLKTIPRWHTPLVPTSYILLGLYSGALVALPLVAYAGGAIAHTATMALLVAALLVKGFYYFRFRAPATAFTINDALPIGKKTIRLLDVGHTHGTFLTDEFYFKLARGHALMLRIVAIVAGFGVPVLALAAGASGVVSLSIVALVCLLGLLAERWLFFAEAEHVVRLYHGATKVAR